MPDPTTTTPSRQRLLAVAERSASRGKPIVITDPVVLVVDPKAPHQRRITPEQAMAETDARLAAGEDSAQAAELDAEVHRLQAAGDPAVRSRFYGDVA